MTEGHTPGPWFVAVDDEGVGTRFPDGAESICCVECGGHEFDAIEVYAFNHNICADPWPNAALIAAAPDLLAACKAALTRFKILEQVAKDSLPSGKMDPSYCMAIDIQDQLSAAIVRATPGAREV